MTREDDVKKALKETKRPSTKKYLAVLLVAVVVFAAYFFVSAAMESNKPIKNATEAQSRASDISQNVGSISSDLDSISQDIGIR